MTTRVPAMPQQFAPQRRGVQRLMVRRQALGRALALDDRLQPFAAEFGRTPGSQGSDGRDHHPFAFSLWLAEPLRVTVRMRRSRSRAADSGRRGRG